MLLFIPVDYRPMSTAEEIKTEMKNRIKTISTQRYILNMISLTPFLWDEGYYIDSTVDESTLKQIINKEVDYLELADNEQRLIFFFKGQKTVDLIIAKNEIDFDIETGIIKPEDAWMNIYEAPDGTIRLCMASG